MYTHGHTSTNALALMPLLVQLQIPCLHIEGFIGHPPRYRVHTQVMFENTVTFHSFSFTCTFLSMERKCDGACHCKLVSSFTRESAYRYDSNTDGMDCKAANLF